MVDIQCVTVIMGGREISRPYQKIVSFTIRQQCIIYPLEFPTVPTSFRISLFGGGGHSGF